MSDANTIVFTVCRDLSLIAAEHWDALAGTGNPFLSHAFLSALEHSGCVGAETGWTPHHLIGRDGDGTIVAAAPAYLKAHSQGEFVFDWAWAEAYEQHGLEYYPKLILAVPFTPVPGPRLLAQDDELKVKLLNYALTQASQDELSSVHALFVTEEQAALVEGDPHWLHRMDCQFHWHNHGYGSFDDFLAACTSKRRKTLRRERRFVNEAGIRIEWRRGDTLSTIEWRQVYQLYASIYLRKWGYPALTQTFWLQLARSMGEQLWVVLAYDESAQREERLTIGLPSDDLDDATVPVACAIMLRGADTLYGRYWGTRTSVNSLHFECCYYQGIDFCIAEGISHFEPGAQGEHKIARGFEPRYTHSLHHLRHPDFHNAVKRYLEQERPLVEQRCTGLTEALPFRGQGSKLKLP